MMKTKNIDARQEELVPSSSSNSSSDAVKDESYLKQLTSSFFKQVQPSKIFSVVSDTIVGGNDSESANGTTSYGIFGAFGGDKK